MAVKQEVTGKERAICSSKIRLGNLSQARHRAILDTKRHGSKHFVYKCAVCQGWHMSTSPEGSIDVQPHWVPLQKPKGPGARRGKDPTWLLFLLGWYYQATNPEDTRIRTVVRHLRRRGAL